MADREPTQEELEKVVRRLRRQDREEAVLNLVEVAALYDQKLQRDDPAHMGRLTKRRKTLGDVIDAAYELIHPPGEITGEDLKYARRMMRHEERSTPNP